MPDFKQTQPKHIRYVYLDVVGFTRNRSIEAQSEIVAALNDVVRSSLSVLDPSAQEILFLPTGDGLGIALLDEPGRYDHHIQLALEILSQVSKRNASTTDPMRRFDVRIGVNENTDNILTDINGNMNVAGAGINIAQRVMSVADAGQLLVGQMVFETLIYREKYMQMFRSYQTKTKHGDSIRIHQFIEEGHEGLVTTPPYAFISPDPKLRRFTEFEAYYLAFAIKHKKLLAKHSGHGQHNYALNILLWFLTNDALELSHATEFNPPTIKMCGKGSASFEEAFKYYMSQDFWLCVDFTGYIRTQLAKLYPYLDLKPGDVNYIVTSAGEQKLRQEYPQIFQEIGITDPGA